MLALIPYYQVPVIHLGSLPIHGFGLLVAIAFIVGGNVGQKRADRVGLDGEHIQRLLSWLVVGTFVGGHVGYGLMYKPQEYFDNPILFLQFWQGLSSFGGFVVCVPLAFYYFKRHNLKMWPYMDSVAFGMAMGWFFGRLACTAAHDHPGTPSDFFLAKYCRPVEGHTVQLPSFMVDDHLTDLRWGPCRDGGAPVTSIDQMVPADFPGVLSAHDMGFYEALWSLAVLGLFLFLDRKPRKPGFYVTLIGVLYGPVRFYMDYLRPESTDGRWFADTMFAMTPGQFWSLVFFGVALWGFAKRNMSAERAYGPTAPLTPAEGGFDRSEAPPI